MVALVHVLVAPWEEPLLRRAALELALIAVSAGALSGWVGLYGLAYGAESLAHALLPGVVGAALLGLPPLLGAAAGVLAAALAVAAAARIPGLSRDTAVAVVVTALVGLGALLALSRRSPPGLEALLFGNVLGATSGDLALAGGLAALVLGGLALGHGRLLAVGFDRAAAPALGIRPAVVDAGLLAVLALAILVAVRGLGNLLVVAVLVAPGAAARPLVARMPALLALASALALGAGVGGLYLSYYGGLPAGAAIALVAVATWAGVTAAAALSRRAGRAGSRRAR